MAGWFSSKINCFYCGHPSQYRKNGKTRQFRCTSCEGTNYLDEDGNITDIPQQVLTTPAEGAPRFVRSSPRTNSSDVPTSSPFCKQCIKNQQIYTECLANYLPTETDPHYEQSMAGFEKYKRDLEKRYPQVCPRCEEAVRARLKKNTYLAQSASFNKTLARPSQLDALGSIGSFMGLVEATWLLSILIQGVWHALNALDKLQLPADQEDSLTSGTTVSLSSCLQAIGPGSQLSPACSNELEQMVRLSFFASSLLLWWNPTMTSFRGKLIINKLSFYAFQATMLFVRWLSWYCIKDGAWSLNRQATRGLHVVMVVMVSFTLAASYRVVAQAPRPKIIRRDLNVPLVDKRDVHYPQEDFISKTSQNTPTRPLFNISTLQSSNNLSRATRPDIPTAESTTPSQSPDFQSSQAVSDSMDWEPAPPQQPLTQLHSLRARQHLAAPQVPPTYPSTSAFSAFPTQPGPNPFYGSLPPAPKSMEARMRASAQQPPPQFRPVSEAKQSDFFRRMQLTQSAGSWANQEYVHRVKQDNDLQEFAPGNLDLDELVGRKADGTGLEEMFGTTFQLDDKSTILDKQEPSPPTPEASNLESLVLLTGMFGIVIVLILISHLAPELWQRVLLSGEICRERIKELAYGHGSG